jgi:hypothetical protein
MSEVGVRLTQVRAFGSESWGGRPRRLGGPRLRFWKRDEASRAVQGGPPDPAVARLISGVKWIPHCPNIVRMVVEIPKFSSSDDPLGILSVIR